jgi:hypothetical protein
MWTIPVSSACAANAHEAERKITQALLLTFLAENTQKKRNTLEGVVANFTRTEFLFQLRRGMILRTVFRRYASRVTDRIVKEMKNK